MTPIQQGTGRVLTTERESELARDVLSQLEGPSGKLTVERDGTRQGALPPEIGRVLQHVLDVMARGATVTIGTVPAELTTSAAAGVLGISRPTLMKMIREGTIPPTGSAATRLKSEDVHGLRAPRARACSLRRTDGAGRRRALTGLPCQWSP